MKLYLAQINTTVGDLEGNARRIVGEIERARALGAALAIFPELATTGYPPRDLLERSSFVADNLAALDGIAGAARGGTTAIVGFVAPSTAGSGNALVNAAALCRDGRVAAKVAKCLLPTYDVFDEDRHFQPGPGGQVVDVNGVPIGLSICEDAWTGEDLHGRRLYEGDPLADQAGRGARLFVNISASPFALGRPAVRDRLFSGHARRHGIPLVCVNLVGGNDQILFDGRSGVVDASGRKVVELAAFKEESRLIDLGPPGAMVGDGAGAAAGAAGADVRAGSIRGVRSDAEEAFDALVMGTRDYISKCGFAKAVIGLSGGIDSSLVAAIAVEALGKDAVTGVSMPSRYSSRGSVHDAAALASNLGMRLISFPIEPIFRAYLETLAPVFAASPPDLTEENLQARIRGALLMALSNRFGSLVLTTGNKSEMAVGFSTLYGDMSGGLAVLSDVPKTLVYAIARHVNRERAVIPEAVLTKAPSAELREDQTDQDTLPPYDLLDAILKLYVEEMKPVREIIAGGYAEEIVLDVVRRVDRSEFKRQQAPPGLRITTKAFGLGRRMPIAQRYVERPR